jgi:hypothetical protein
MSSNKALSNGNIIRYIAYFPRELLQIWLSLVCLKLIIIKSVRNINPFPYAHIKRDTGKKRMKKK